MDFVSKEESIRMVPTPFKDVYSSIDAIPQDEIRKLIDLLNYYTDFYEKGKPLISDQAWDDMYFTVKEWERIKGIVYPNSPTQNIFYQTVSKLEPIEHEHLMLSLDKTKDPLEIDDFMGKQEYVAMFKMDGLTCSLTYENGILTRAETRGNGKKGENILHNARVVKNIPQKISITNRKVVVDGEIICNISNFAKFQKEYKNPRNFAAGSIRLLSAEECSKRNLEFIAWDLIEGYKSINFFLKLDFLKGLGFTVVPYIYCKNTFEEPPSDTIEKLDELRKQYSHYPIDGYVFKFDNIEYGEKKGKTDHHFKNAIAFKFYDELYDTHLKYIDWTMGRTGVLTPVAVFEPIDINGSIVERASLHNISVMRDVLGDCSYVGEPLKVAKMNMIIPQVLEAGPKMTYEEVLKHGRIKALDEISICPICGGEVLITPSDNGILNAICQNPSCEGKLINRLDHFCGKKGLDIKGISKATLNKLIDWGWVESPIDIFTLCLHKSEWVKKAGFGIASVNKILNSIEEHKKTTLTAFISSLGVPLIGVSVAKILAETFDTYEDFRKAVDNKEYSFELLAGFGPEMNSALKSFDFTEADSIVPFLSIETKKITKEESITNEKLKDKVVVITGKLTTFKNRNELKEIILKNGGKVTDSITSKTSLLINNDINSTSSKNKAAKSKGIPIISETDFIQSYLEN